MGGTDSVRGTCDDEGVVITHNRLSQLHDAETKD